MQKLPIPVQLFLKDYPQELASASRVNLDFYRDEGTAARMQPDNMTLSAAHHFYRGNYGELERRHGFIQWFFPIRAPSSANSYSVPLTREERDIFRKSFPLQVRFRDSFVLMLDFYGIQFNPNIRRRQNSPSSAPASTSETPTTTAKSTQQQQQQQQERESGESVSTDERGKLHHDDDDDVVITRLGMSRTSQWAARYRNLVRQEHNFLRITRMLMSASEVGLEDLGVAWLVYILHEQARGQLTGRALVGSMDMYWIHCLRRATDRDFIATLTSRVRRGDGFSEAQYERVLAHKERTGIWAFTDPQSEL